jgi:hypothetical protein
VVFLCVAGFVSAAQQPSAKPQSQSTHARNRHRSHTHRANTRSHAKTEPFVNQGPHLPQDSDAVQTAAAAPATDPCHSEHSFCGSSLAMAYAAADLPAPVPEPPLVITYQSGVLSISAKDVPLREILERIQTVTGATVDAPPLEQRLTLQLEPRLPVLAIPMLVDGMQLDYALAGGTSANDPLRRIILMPRSKPRADAMRANVPVDSSLQPRTASVIHSEQTGGDEGVWEPAVPAARPGRHH